MMICTRAQFTEDHFANGLRSMTTTHDALPVAGRFVDALVAIPVDVWFFTLCYLPVIYLKCTRS